MYNKYIGNTGKYIRVEDHPRVDARSDERQAAIPPPVSRHEALHRDVVSDREDIVHPAESLPSSIHHSQRSSVLGGKSKPSLFGGIGGGLSGLLGSGSKGLGGLSDSFRGMFDHLPFGLDIGDIILLLLLLFFFIESGDEEFIIILGIIAYGIFKDR